jgi:transcriptional regulator with XRE-family HTH domain
VLLYIADMTRADHYRAVACAVGVRIRQHRRQLSLSAEDCARAAKMHSRRIWLRYEHGDALPSCLMLWRIADVLGVRVDRLRPTEAEVLRRAHKRGDPLYGHGLTPRERALLRFVAHHVNGFWQGMPFDLHDMASTATGCKLTRRQVLTRARALESRGVLILVRGGAYRICGEMQRSASGHCDRSCAMKCV